MASNKGRKTNRSTDRGMIRERPIATAAIISGIAAGIAGFLAFKRSGKTFSEFSDDVATKVKDGLAEAKTKAEDVANWRKDGLDETASSQTEIAEEALTLKQTGKKTKRPVDPVIEEELKTGAVSY